jgi:nickel/cobalt exporter
LRGRRLVSALVAVAALSCVLAAQAAAHPLGNFSVNHLSQVRLDEGRAQLTYVLDQAEIPTFQEVQRYDADGSGAIEPGAERGAVLARKLEEIESGLELRIDGAPVALGEPRASSIEYPAGVSDLVTTRVEASYEVPLRGPPAEVELRDETYPGRVGWKAVQALPGSGTDVQSSVPTEDPTGGLRSYPEDLLESPLDVTSASFSVRPGDGTVSGPDGPAGRPAGDDGAADGFAGLLTSSDSLLILLLGAAFAWGALHALAPGHGKSMVAAYLAGSSGKPAHALILGASLTVSHTIVVFALGVVTLALSQYILPEDLYPWLGIASGVMVAAVGFWVMRSRFRRWRALRVRGHAQGHRHAHGHAHGPSRGESEPTSVRSLVALGAAGGLVPCPSALVVLIAAISQHRVGTGLALILAFSVGLATTLTLLGLVVIHGVRIARRAQLGARLLGGRFVGALPAISATAIVAIGTVIAVRAAAQI